MPMSIAELIPNKDTRQSSVLASSVNSSRIDFVPGRPIESHLNMQ